jgi:hypothetical protein
LIFPIFPIFFFRARAPRDSRQQLLYGLLWRKKSDAIYMGYKSAGWDLGRKSTEIGGNRKVKIGRLEREIILQICEKGLIQFLPFFSLIGLRQILGVNLYLLIGEG